MGSQQLFLGPGANIIAWQLQQHILWHLAGDLCLLFVLIQCTVRQKDYFAQLTASVKIYLGFKIHFLLKCPFLTVFGKIYSLTKVDVLGTWEVTILFRNSGASCFVLYWGHHIFQEISINWPATYWQLLKQFLQSPKQLRVDKNIPRWCPKLLNNLSSQKLH